MKRVITALLLIPIISYAIVWAPYWFFAAVLTAVALICFYEYSGIVEAHGIEKPGWVGYVAGLAVLFVPQAGIAGITAIALVALSLSLGVTKLDDRALPRAATLFLGILYIFGAWRCAIDLRVLDPRWLVFALALNWVGDTAAYYVGRAIGKHKLAPVVSPGKSWEGAVASTVATVGFGALYFSYLLPAVPLCLGLTIAALGNVAGQFGDLCESALKRGAGLKDSGHMLPGHGGWLDRVDSSLFAIPVVLLVLHVAEALLPAAVPK